jgi:glycosyltransferase involved in cell wall biosynthesis
MNKVTNLTIGTDKDGQGGIASVLTVLNDSGFFSDTNSLLLSSHKINPKLGHFSKPYYFLSSLCKLIYYLLFFRIGLIHIHMSSGASFARKSIILKIAKLFKVKTIIHLHSGGFPSFYKQSSQSNKKKIENSLNSADRIIVLSKQAMLWVNTHIKDNNKVRIIYNAVPKEAFPQKMNKQQIILFLGHLGQHKGVDDLISAFARLLENHPNTLLHLAGEGNIEKYKAQVDKLRISSNVSFLGWVTGEDKKQCLIDSTIFCLPSYYEAFGMGILEAMSAEVVVVSTKVGGIPDVIEHGKEGILIETGDIDELTEVLSTLLVDTSLRNRLTNSAKIKYQTNFTPEVIIPQLKKIYKELLE